MESFSLLKYWKGAAALPPPTDTTNTTAILAAVSQNDTETDDDDGPFFDLEFTVPDEEDSVSEDPNVNQNDEEDEDEDDDDDNNNEEFNFTLSPSTNDRSDPNLSLSPSHHVFFKQNPNLNTSEPNSKPQLTSSLLKSATKFRVFMLGLKKPKPNVASDKEPNASEPEPPKKPQQRKLFTVKFKVEEVPIVSLFTGSKGGAGKASPNQNAEESHAHTQTQSLSSASDEKRLMRKYLKMVKPLYVRVSRRYGEKLRFSEQLNVSSPESGKPTTAEKVQTEAEASETAVKVQKQGNIPLPAGLRVVCKHLGKSRSASSSAPATTSAPAAAALVSSRRRDDSLLQQQDGIQGAILHCKRSFNASRECESSQLPRSVSDPLHEISTHEGKDK